MYRKREHSALITLNKFICNVQISFRKKIIKIIQNNVRNVNFIQEKNAKSIPKRDMFIGNKCLQKKLYFKIQPEWFEFY